MVVWGKMMLMVLDAIMVGNMNKSPSHYTEIARDLPPNGSLNLMAHGPSDPM